MYESAPTAYMENAGANEDCVPVSDDDAAMGCEELTTVTPELHHKGRVRYSDKP